MKVRLVVTVDVEPRAWAQHYGVDPYETDADVRRYFKNQVLQANALVEVQGLEVTVR